MKAVGNHHHSYKSQSTAKKVRCSNFHLLYDNSFTASCSRLWAPSHHSLCRTGTSTAIFAFSVGIGAAVDADTTTTTAAAARKMLARAGLSEQGARQTTRSCPFVRSEERRPGGQGQLRPYACVCFRDRPELHALTDNIGPTAR